jgi:hypothetical protein
VFEGLVQAGDLIEKTNTNLEPELLTREAAAEGLRHYARLEKLVAFGKAMLAHRLDDPAELARVTGTSVPKAKETVETGHALQDAGEVRAALQTGAISLDQASAVATAERARPGTSSELLAVAAEESFQVLRERSPARLC